MLRSRYVGAFVLNQVAVDRSPDEFIKITYRPFAIVFFFLHFWTRDVETERPTVTFSHGTRITVLRIAGRAHKGVGCVDNTAVCRHNGAAAIGRPVWFGVPYVCPPSEQEIRPLIGQRAACDNSSGGGGGERIPNGLLADGPGRVSSCRNNKRCGERKAIFEQTDLLLTVDQQVCGEHHVGTHDQQNGEVTVFHSTKEKSI